MWEVVARGFPYEDQTFGWIEDVKDAVLAGVRPTLTHVDARQDYVDLMRQCWSSDPDERPSFDKIVDRLHTMLVTSSRGDRSHEHLDIDETGV